MKSYEERIKENLRNEILTCGKSKTQIARELSISKPTLSQYLSGRIMPSLATFGRLCEVIDCSADDILFDKKQKMSKNSEN